MSVARIVNELGEGVFDSTSPGIAVTLEGAGDASAANQLVEQTLLGSTTETAPGDDTASSGLNGRLQRISQRLTSLIALVPASLGAKLGAASFSVVAASDGFSATAIGNVASGVADSGNPVKVGGKYNLTVPTFTDGQRADFQADARGNQRAVLVLSNTGGSDAVSNSNLSMGLSQSAQSGGNFLAVGGLLYNGSTWDRPRGDSNGAVVQSALSANFWNYAAASGGISNTTTAVTIKGAAGASVRNYLKTLQVDSDALGAATELVIRDGAGGTVLWRGKIGTAGYPDGRAITFDPPLKGTANTLMEVVTLTASVTGAVFVNAQGYTGA